MREDYEIIDYLSDLMDIEDSDVLYEGSATSSLEQSYQDTIKMAETRAKLAEQSAKLAKEIFKKALKRMDAYVEMLERDKDNYLTIANAFRSAGFENLAVECEDKAEALGQIVSAHKSYKTSVEQQMAAVSS